MTQRIISDEEIQDRQQQMIEGYQRAQTPSRLRVIFGGALIALGGRIRGHVEQHANDAPAQSGRWSHRAIIAAP